MNKKKTKLDAIISDLAGDLKPAVERIEKDKLATTQNHYGDYLNMITMLSHGDLRMAKVIVAALLDAGANHAGVTSAYKIYHG